MEHMEDLNARMDRFEQMIQDVLSSSAAAQAAGPGLPSSIPNPLADSVSIQPTLPSAPSNDIQFSMLWTDVDQTIAPTTISIPPAPSAANAYQRTSPTLELSPVTSSRLKSFNEGNGQDRFQVSTHRAVTIKCLCNPGVSHCRDLKRRREL